MGIQTNLAVGNVLGGRYVIRERIGSGGMSHVYLAEDLRLPGKRWAVKESVGADMAKGGEIEAEARLLTTLSHRRLPRVADFYPPDEAGYCYLVMDYIEGVTLAESMRSAGFPPTPEFIARCARQILEVLIYLHELSPPVIYRDLKPSNIMFDRTGELMLIDLGIARQHRPGAAEDTEKLGTEGFAAPEQYGGGQSSPASDLYGLGALLLYMATGGRHTAWQPRMEERLRGAVPEGWIPPLRRLLRYHPEERFASARQALAALEACGPAEDRPGRASGGPDRRPGTGAFGQGTQRESPGAPPPVLIPLLGVAPGLGTTHASLAAAAALAAHGTVAWVDLTPQSPVFRRFARLLAPGEPAATPADPSIGWRGVRLWALPDGGALDEVLATRPDFVVLDLGTGEEVAARERFARGDCPVLVASGADWRLAELPAWLRRSGLAPEPRWRLALPLAERAAAAYLESALGAGEARALPPQPDPFQRKGKLGAVLLELLEPALRLRRERQKTAAKMKPQ
ncbi:serine/threonine-protein kinase [Paenibacillus sp. NFR01]|uniref:serine/threonine protein kinase n=1 Tax=Paenibacillus sp. NFR01 TaxID=1566279 RepID=UPI0008BFE8BE|nr:serine/threonine-protein kinase [Paenibacillus sp. NFR01]SET32659.1 serine/threonine protein kinase [Paenibacillus sp. NFR01]